MNYEIERKILNNFPLTKEEVNVFLSFICEKIRKTYNISNPFDSDCQKCYEVSQCFGRITLTRFGCDVLLLNINELLQIPLTHYANIISFNVDGNKKSYLVDMTYSQFWSDTVTLDNNETKSTKSFLKFMDNDEFVKQLRYYGFIEINDIILNKYINSFLELCNIKKKDNLYININELLNKNNINLTLKK